MNIVVIAGYGPSLVNFRGPLLREMVAHGHAVTALAPQDDPDIRQQLAGLGVGFQPIRLSRRGLNPLRDLATLQSIRNALRSTGPDMVLSYTIKPVIYGSLAARLERVASVNSMVTGLGSAFFRSGVSGRAVKGLVQGLYRAALRHNRLVIFQNPDDEAFFRSKGLVPPSVRTLVTPGSGVDLARFAPVPLPATKTDATPDTPPTFLLIARLLRAKGICEFAEAARLVRQKYPQARFHLVGPLEPGEGTITERELAAWRQEGLIEWFGLQEDVRPRLAGCTVFVLPSYYGEGLPRTLLEAAATGRAAITTDHPGCREAVINGETGLLVPVRNARALASAMKRFIVEPGLARTMGGAALRLAQTRFDAALVNRQILEALHLC